MQTIEVREFAGERLDVFIQHYLKLSRSRIQKLIEQSHIRVLSTSKSIKSNYKVKIGDKIEIDECVFLNNQHKSTIDIGKMKVDSNGNLEDIKPEKIDLNIMYEDEYIIVINKPRGMVVHPAPGFGSNGTLVNALLYHCGKHNLSQSQSLRPGIVHRIDKFTSGVIVVAKTDKVHDLLKKQFQEHTITRKYIALVMNDLKDDKGTIDVDIGRHPDYPNKRIAVTKNSKIIKNPKHAITHYNVLERFKASTPGIKKPTQFTLIECTLETGRTHQIRVHLSHIGRSIVGDTVYGSKKKQPFPELKGPALHARLLGFLHPITNKYIEFEAPLPDYFKKLINFFKSDKSTNKKSS